MNTEFEPYGAEEDLNTRNMAENKNETSKTNIIKSLAIIGLVVLVILSIWLVVQLVRVLPAAFDSLASVADVVYSTDPYEDDRENFITLTERSIVNEGESFELAWSGIENGGIYSFTYGCTEGVALEVRTSNGDVYDVTCDTPLTLPEGTDAKLDVIASSEKNRFIEVDYLITFSPEEEGAESFDTDGSFTVVNPEIPQRVSENSDVPTNDEGAEVETEVDTPDVPEMTTTPSGPTGEVSGVSDVIVTKPVSDPNGYVDLRIYFLAAGNIDNNTFKKDSVIDNDELGGVQFVIQNNGTKTSKSFEFEIDLPDGSTYESNDQLGLKPKERAIYTLGFDVDEDETGTEVVRGEVSVDNDRNTSDNSFSKSVKIVN